MRKRKSTREYIEECKEKGIDLPIESYLSNRTKIQHKCSKGHVYLQIPNAHLNGQGCPICKGTFKKTPKEYYEECKEKGIDLPIESYINNNTKIKHKCTRCDTTYEQRPLNHLKGQQCPYCSKQKKTPQEYYEECKNKGLDLPIEDYVNGRTKIKFKCSNNHIYLQSPRSHLQGHGCPICNARKKTNQQYIEECKQKRIDLPIEKYKGDVVKIKHKCKQGHTYYQRPNDHLQSHGCPYCSQSHGERFIRNYLDKHHIPYEPQKKFEDLKDKQPLSYDFYLPKKKVLIEYQGEQHFKSVSFSNKSKSDIQTQQYHDKLKREYAKDNGYTLLEPTYKLDTQEKINSYLDKYLSYNEK